MVIVRTRLIHNFIHIARSYGPPTIQVRSRCHDVRVHLRGRKNSSDSMIMHGLLFTRSGLLWTLARLFVHSFSLGPMPPLRLYRSHGFVFVTPVLCNIFSRARVNKASLYICRPPEISCRPRSTMCLYIYHLFVHKPSRSYRFSSVSAFLLGLPMHPYMKRAYDEGC